MAIQCCGEHLHTETEVRIHNEREHGAESIPAKNDIEVRSWWQHSVLGKFKFFWQCPECPLFWQSDREDIIIWRVLSHEEVHHR